GIRVLALTPQAILGRPSGAFGTDSNFPGVRRNSQRGWMRSPFEPLAGSSSALNGLASMRIKRTRAGNKELSRRAAGLEETRSGQGTGWVDDDRTMRFAAEPELTNRPAALSWRFVDENIPWLREGWPHSE